VLREGYVFLRNLEHRIQIVEGRQSQMIPPRPAELERLARMMSFRDIDGRKAGAYFWEEYKKKTAAVHDVYRSLFYRSEEEAVELPAKILALFAPEITEEEASERLGALVQRPAGGLPDLSLLRTGPLHTPERGARMILKLARYYSRPQGAGQGAFNLGVRLRHRRRTTFYSFCREPAGPRRACKALRHNMFSQGPYRAPEPHAALGRARERVYGGVLQGA
jgi:hypothetical protein